jgi:hypothetical protein
LFQELNFSLLIGIEGIADTIKCLPRASVYI